MVKEIIKINGAMDKPKKAGGTYRAYQTNKGDIGVFESDVSNVLDKMVGKFITVDLATRPNGFINITACYDEATEIEFNSQATPQPATTPSTSPSTQEQVLSKVLHEMVDSHKIEVGNAGCRVTAKGHTITECINNARDLLTAARALMAQENEDAT